jgi:hypothetical protein
LSGDPLQDIFYIFRHTLFQQIPLTKDSLNNKPGGLRMETIKKLSPALFGIIIFCFFLPFINLSCGGQKVMSLTGFQLITGTEYKPSGMFDQQNMFGDEDIDMTNQKSEQIEAQPFALFAFLAAIVGLLLSLFKNKTTALLSMIVSVSGCIFLILLKVDIDNDAAISGQGMQGIIQVDYQFGYWLVFLLFMLGAVVQWLLFKEPENQEITTEIPPANK